MSRNYSYIPNRTFDRNRSSGKPKYSSRYIRNNDFPAPYGVGEIFLLQEDEREILLIVIKDVRRDQKRKSYKYLYEEKRYSKDGKDYSGFLWSMTYNEKIDSSIIHHEKLNSLIKFDDARLAKIILTCGEMTYL